MDRLSERGLSAQDARNLFRFIDWLMNLPKPQERLFWNEVAQIKEEKRMPYVSTGERLAREDALLAGIEVSLEAKFGPEGLALLPEIRQLPSNELLFAVLQGIRTANNPEELRRIWSA